MLRFNEVLAVPPPAKPDGVLTLTFEQRRISRLRATLDDGREVALLLLRGTNLRDGDHLRGEGGIVVVVRAAEESLSVASTDDQHLLLRAAYHLGNRHVPVQLGNGFVAYAHDHVLDDMVRGLGLAVVTKTEPFEPEAGAFAHEHEHAHEHGHEHGHEDEDEDEDGDEDGDGHGHSDD